MMLNQHFERLEGLSPLIQAPAREVIARCEKKLGRILLVVSGWRSSHEQMLKYQQGRTLNRETNIWEVTDESRVVTRSHPGLSAHNVISRVGEPASMAFDVIPMMGDGSPEWMVDDNFWDALYEISWKCGLDPLGDPVGAYLPQDKGHLEEPAWKMKLEGLGLLLPYDDKGVAIA